MGRRGRYSRLRRRDLSCDSSCCCDTIWGCIPKGLRTFIIAMAIIFAILAVVFAILRLTDHSLGDFFRGIWHGCEAIWHFVTCHRFRRRGTVEDDETHLIRRGTSRSRGSSFDDRGESRGPTRSSSNASIYSQSAQEMTDFGNTGNPQQFQPPPRRNNSCPPPLPSRNNGATLPPHRSSSTDSSDRPPPPRANSLSRPQPPAPAYGERMTSSPYDFGLQFERARPPAQQRGRQFNGSAQRYGPGDDNLYDGREYVRPPRRGRGHLQI